MAIPIQFPAETRKTILEYLYHANQTAWQVSNGFRTMRLVSRAWCTSANELLFSYVLLRAERNLDCEIKRITDFNQMTKTGLSNHVKALEVFASPTYYRFSEEHPRAWAASKHVFSPTTDTLDCITHNLPECIPRLRNLQTLEFSLCESSKSHESHSYWSLSFNDRFRYCEAICRSLSISSLPKLYSLSLEMAELRDLAIFSGKRFVSPDSEDSCEKNQKDRRPKHLAENLSRIRDLFITINAKQRNLWTDNTQSRHDDLDWDEPQRHNTYSVAWKSLRDLFAVGFESLEHLDIELDFYYSSLHSLDEKIFKIGNVTELRYLSLKGFNMTPDGIIRILDTFHESLEEVHLSLLQMRMKRKVLKGFLGEIRAKLRSIPQLKKATIYGLNRQFEYVKLIMHPGDWSRKG